MMELPSQELLLIFSPTSNVERFSQLIITRSLTPFRMTIEFIWVIWLALWRMKMMKISRRKMLHFCTSIRMEIAQDLLDLMLQNWLESIMKLFDELLKYFFVRFSIEIRLKIFFHRFPRKLKPKVCVVR